MKDLIDKQARFWVLMAGGSTLVAACATVRVNRRTGRRWRQATGGQIPRKKPPSSGRYLCLDERLRIADLHLAGSGIRVIARQLGRSPATISRELARNTSASTSRRAYAPYAAQKRAAEQGLRPKNVEVRQRGACVGDTDEVVQTKLCLKWSPEQTGRRCV